MKRSAGVFRRLNSAPWTPYLEECCQILGTPNSNRDDQCAVALVRIQLLAEKIGQSPWHGRPDFVGHPAPPGLYLDSLQDQVKKLGDELTSSLNENSKSTLHAIFVALLYTVLTNVKVSVLLSYHNLEVLLYKVGLSKSPKLYSFTDRDFHRLEYLFSCLQAVKSFFDAFFTIPPAKYHCLSVPMLSHVTWNMGILQLMTTFDHPDWSTTFAKQTLDFVGVIEELAKRFSEVKSAIGYDSHTADDLDIFSQSAKRMATIRVYFVNRAANISEQPPEDTRIEPVNVEMLDFASGGDMMDFLDDAWMRDILGAPWEFQNPI